MTSIIDAWILFFQNAGVHKDLHRRYAQRFVKEHIQSSMLKDIGKSELSDLGVNTVGDQLCILRYIKSSDGIFGEFKDVNEGDQLVSQDLAKNEIPEVRSFRSENKIFYFDSKLNNRGAFLKITEVKPAVGHRSSITISARALSQFCSIVNELDLMFSKLDIDGGSFVQRSKGAKSADVISGNSVNVPNSDGDKNGTKTD